MTRRDCSGSKAKGGTLQKISTLIGIFHWMKPLWMLCLYPLYFIKSAFARKIRTGRLLRAYYGENCIRSSHILSSQVMDDESKHRSVYWWMGFAISLSLVIFAIAWFMFAWNNFWVVHAAEQIEVFDRALEMSEDLPPHEIVGHLRHMLHYYPTGTKHAAGSFLDRIVESHRRLVIKNIISIMKSKTQLDLGTDPEPWIEHFKGRDKELSDFPRN